jgi:hypothetical protein
VDFVLVCAVALAASALTLYSGFGLGTLLLPAFAVFFPVPVAVAATAVVHLANNLFKTALVGRHADRQVVLRFALPGVVAAIIGASLLGAVSSTNALATYDLWGQTRDITAVKLLIGTLVVGFALLEMSPWLAGLTIEKRFLPLGGVLSGFFGGLSGSQGVLRAAFLVKVGLSKEAYIGTSTVSAVIVDLSRIPVYGVALLALDVEDTSGMWPLVAGATLFAFAGAYLGNRYVHKVTLHALQVIVTVMLVAVGTAMATGLV